MVNEIKNKALGGNDLNDTDADPTWWNLTFNEVVKQMFGGQGENAYKTLQANDVFANDDNLMADEFVDSNGTNNTVNTGSTTATYYSGDTAYKLGFTDEAGGDTTHDPDTYTNVANAFDGDDGTYANKTSGNTTSQYVSQLGKTFGSKTISVVKIKAYIEATVGFSESKPLNIVLQTYDGISWSDNQTLATTADAQNLSYDDTVYFTSGLTTQGLRIKCTTEADPDNRPTEHRLYTLEYGDFDSSDTILLDSGTLTLDGTENSLGGYLDCDFPTNTSVTVTASDGTTSSSAATVDTKSKYFLIGDISSLSSGTLQVTLTLATSDGLNTPAVRGCGFKIHRSE